MNGLTTEVKEFLILSLTATPTFPIWVLMQNIWQRTFTSKRDVRLLSVLILKSQC